jgi:hypothetical protein
MDAGNIKPYSDQSWWWLIHSRLSPGLPSSEAVSDVVPPTTLPFIGRWMYVGQGEATIDLPIMSFFYLFLLDENILSAIIEESNCCRKLVLVRNLKFSISQRRKPRIKVETTNFVCSRAVSNSNG